MKKIEAIERLIDAGDRADWEGRELDAMAFYQGALVMAMSIKRLDLCDKILDIIDLLYQYKKAEIEFQEIENSLERAKAFFRDSKSVYKKPSWWERLKILWK